MPQIRKQYWKMILAWYLQFEFDTCQFNGFSILARYLYNQSTTFPLLPSHLKFILESCLYGSGFISFSARSTYSVEFIFYLHGIISLQEVRCYTYWHTIMWYYFEQPQISVIKVKEANMKYSNKTIVILAISILFIIFSFILSIDMYDSLTF